MRGVELGYILRGGGGGGEEGQGESFLTPHHHSRMKPSCRLFDVLLSHRLLALNFFRILSVNMSSVIVCCLNCFMFRLLLLNLVLLLASWNGARAQSCTVNGEAKFVYETSAH